MAERSVVRPFCSPAGLALCAGLLWPQGAAGSGTSGHRGPAVGAKSIDAAARSAATARGEAQALLGSAPTPAGDGAAAHWALDGAVCCGPPRAPTPVSLVPSELAGPANRRLATDCVPWPADATAPTAAATAASAGTVHRRMGTPAITARAGAAQPGSGTYGDHGSGAARLCLDQKWCGANAASGSPSDDSRRPAGDSASLDRSPPGRARCLPDYRRCAAV